MNFTQIAGHLGADPEERRTPTGKKVTRLRVATKLWNEGKEETLWWDVSVWGDEFDNVLKHLKKGHPVWVLGVQRKPRIWNDRENRPQVSLELTARIVSFSPFGKADHPRSDGGMGSGAAIGEEGVFSSASAMGGGYRYEAPSTIGPQDEEMPF